MEKSRKLGGWEIMIGSAQEFLMLERERERESP